MEKINKKYYIKTKNSKAIIYMRGGILGFSTKKGQKMKKIQIQNKQNRFLQISSRWVILNQRKTNYGEKLKSDVFKACLILTR